MDHVPGVIGLFHGQMIMDPFVILVPFGRKTTTSDIAVSWGQGIVFVVKHNNACFNLQRSCSIIFVIM